MTPTKKGNYNECDKCTYQTKEDVKYPCSFSHKKIRLASGQKLERNFSNCGLFNSLK